MEVTLEIGGLLDFLLGFNPKGDDLGTVIGDSRVAYLSKKDKGHVFLPAAIWHDAAYTKGASIQETWPRWKVDLEFLKKMLDIAQDDYGLTKEALSLYLAVRKYGAHLYEGPQN